MMTVETELEQLEVRMAPSISQPPKHGEIGNKA